MMEWKIPWWLRKKDDGAAVRAAADYTVISEAGAAIVRLLKEHLIPDLIADREGIGLCSPTDHGDMVLGVYLYDIRENEEVRVNGMQPLDDEYLQFPPMYLNLYYMITAFLTIDVKYRAEEEQRLMGKAMQVLHDNPLLQIPSLMAQKGAGDDGLVLEYQNLDMEEKTKIWGMVGSPYRLSLFYKISPVRLSSSIVKKTARVMEIDIRTRQEGR